MLDLVGLKAIYHSEAFVVTRRVSEEMLRQTGTQQQTTGSEEKF